MCIFKQTHQDVVFKLPLPVGMRLIRNSLFILLLQMTYLNAQEIEGFVFQDSTRLPLSDVTIIHKRTNTGTTTNSLGKFTLRTNLNINDTIIFSHIGYLYKSLTIRDLKAQENEVFLTQEIEELNEVSVVSDRDLKLRNTIRFERLSSLKKGVHSFAAIAYQDSILVIGGDESIEENEIRRRLIRDPALHPQKALELSGGDTSWRHYSGKIQVYDIALDRWKVSTIKIRNRAYHGAHLHKEKLYIFGGKRLVQRGKYEYLDDQIEVVCLKTGAVQIDNTNPHKASSPTSFINGNNLIVAGGAISENIRGEKKYSDKLHQYNFESGYWYVLGTLPTSGNIIGTLVDNKFYSVIWNKNSLGELYSFNLDSGVWNLEEQMIDGLEAPAITAIDDAIYIFENNRILKFDIESKSLKEYIINLDFTGANLLCIDNHIYIIGGVREDRYSKTPSSGLYRIPLTEFNKTRFRQHNFTEKHN